MKFSRIQRSYAGAASRAAMELQQINMLQHGRQGQQRLDDV